MMPFPSPFILSATRLFSTKPTLLFFFIVDFESFESDKKERRREKEKVLGRISYRRRTIRRKIRKREKARKKRRVLKRKK